MPQIVVENLVKRYRVSARGAGLWGALKGAARRRYREVEALDGVSFAIGAGELVGCIGPNGAGKSTAVKIMAGILTPDSGACEILGRVPWRRRGEHVRDIGVAFGQRTQLWWDLPVMESFDLLRDIYRVPRADYARSRDELVEAMRLEPLLDTPARQLSLGQRMRCDLAAALLHSPKILFLDEPTIGLDAVSKLAFRDFMRRFNRERGATVILTTHDIADVEALRERVMAISGGRIISDGPLDSFRRRVSGERRLAARLRGRRGGGRFLGRRRGRGQARRRPRSSAVRPGESVGGGADSPRDVRLSHGRPVRGRPADRGNHRAALRRRGRCR